MSDGGEKGAAVDPNYPADMVRADAHQFLKASYRQLRDTAWHLEQYQRGQRDEYNSKIRFGLTTANAASLVTALNIADKLAGVTPGELALACALFLLGTVASGYSLFAQQNYLTRQSGNTYAWAMAMDRAVALIDAPPGSPNFQLAGETQREAAALQAKVFDYSKGTIIMQALGWGAWLGGAVTLAGASAIRFWPWLHHLGF